MTVRTAYGYVKVVLAPCNAGPLQIIPRNRVRRGSRISQVAVVRCCQTQDKETGHRAGGAGDAREVSQLLFSVPSDLGQAEDRSEEEVNHYSIGEGKELESCWVLTS